jgi:proteic killer suppression protein
MILSYRDGRTERFARGEHVRDFSGFRKQAEVRLDRLEAATSLKDSRSIAREPVGSFEGRSEGAIQHQNQRSMANLLRMA